MIEQVLNSPTAFGAALQDNFTILLNLDQSCMGTPSDEVKSAVRHLCGLITPEMNLEPIHPDNYYEAAKTYYDQIKASDPTRRQLSIFLLMFSSYYHEIRHAHDLMATTFGQDILFGMMNCYQNTPAVLTELTNWLSADLSRRIPLPLKDNISECNGISSDIVRIIDKYNEFFSELQAFQKLNRASSFCVTTTHLLETLAIDIQMDFIHDLYGDEAVILLTEVIQRSPQSTTYLRIRNDLRDAFYQAGYRGDKLGVIINYVSWISLMGATFPGAKLSEGPSAVVLFEGLSDYLVRKAKSKSLEEAMKAISTFCREWGFLEPNDMQHKVRTVLLDRESKLINAISALPPGNSIEPLAKAYSSFIKSFIFLHDLIANSPLSYFGQRIYVWSFLHGIMPSVHVKVKEKGKSDDFMSLGQEKIKFDDWNLFCLFSTVFRVLMEGRAALRTFFDDMVMNLLLEQGWQGTKWRFIDRSGLFDL